MVKGYATGYGTFLAGAAMGGGVLAAANLLKNFSVGFANKTISKEAAKKAAATATTAGEAAKAGVANSAAETLVNGASNAASVTAGVQLSKGLFSLGPVLGPIAIGYAATVAIASVVRGYITYGDFVIDRVGRMLGTEPAVISPLLYRGKPYTAGLEGYRHDNMSGHIRTMLDDMSIIDRIGHPYGYDSAIINMGTSNTPGDQYVDNLVTKIVSYISPGAVGSIE